MVTSEAFASKRKGILGRRRPEPEGLVHFLAAKAMAAATADSSASLRNDKTKELATSKAGPPAGPSAPAARTPPPLRMTH